MSCSISQFGVGIGTCNAIAEAAIGNNLNYRNIFYNQLPAGILTGRRLTALNHARTVCHSISGWLATDTLAQRSTGISSLLTVTFNAAIAASWTTYAANLPQQMTIEEIRDWLWADTDEQQAAVLASVFTRLNQPVPATAALPPRVRIMSMHGANGLSARVVFIPALEEELFPGPWRRPNAGLVLEAARLFYVSITRARATCILSNAALQGQAVATAPSRFTTSLGSAFTNRAAGLTSAEVQQIMTDITKL